jgi:hypothetical protein
MAKRHRISSRNQGGPGKKARQSTSSSSEANSSELDVGVWNDPEWRPALDALEGWQPDGKFIGKPDPRPLAKLLRSGKPVPEAVAVRLGIFLDPEWGKKGPSLTMSIPKRYSGHGDLRRLKEMIAAKQEIKKARERTGKLEAAIAEVKEKTGLSRSYLMRAWKLDTLKIVRMTSKFNPQPSLSPREQGKS